MYKNNIIYYLLFIIYYAGKAVRKKKREKYLWLVPCGCWLRRKFVDPSFIKFIEGIKKKGKTNNNNKQQTHRYEQT